MTTRFRAPTGSPPIPPRGRCRSGYTFVELLIVMMIVLIVSTISVPPLARTVDGSLVEEARQAFIGDLRMARMEAIRRNVSIAVHRTGPTTYQIDSLGTRTLPNAVAFTSGPDSVRFPVMGPTSIGETSFALQLRQRTTTVRVTASGNAQ